MDEVMNVGGTILPDGQPLSLITRAGIESWLENGTKHSYRYNQMRDPLSFLESPKLCGRADIIDKFTEAASLWLDDL